jgi:hypothetical protein
MTNTMKADLIRLLKGTKGVPKHRQKEFDSILKLLEDKKTVIPPEDFKKVSIFIAGMFCAIPTSKRATRQHKHEGIIPITPENIRKVRSFSDTHLETSNVIKLHRRNGKT